MKLALLGVDEELLNLVRGTVDGSEYELVAAFDYGPHAANIRAIAPAARVGEDWESLLLGSLADVVIVGRGQAGLSDETGIADDERRADQLRKLAQAGVKLVVVHPACEAIVGFELEMIRRDNSGVIVPILPGFNESALQAAEQLIAQGAASPIGALEQLVFEREQADRSRQAVLVQFARDVSLLRRMVGEIRKITASGPATPTTHDPLGPKPKTLPPLANLSVHLQGEREFGARWSIGPAQQMDVARLSLVGSKGKALLTMPLAGAWSLDVASEQPLVFSSPTTSKQLGDLLDRFAELSGGPVSWLNACRDVEAAESIDRSLRRGRTIELLNEEHTEEESFKGVMAMGGCLLLLMALGAVFLATIVEGLQLPLRNWAVWKYWPIYLLIPVVAFLLLQLLQLVVKRDVPDVRKLVSDDQDR